LYKYYHALDLYLVTSRNEGGPKSVLESMASGVPLVTTAVGMAPDVVLDGINGRLCSSFDPEAIAAIATELLDDDTCRADLMKVGKGPPKYSWERSQHPI
jgi:glycosyltransferase involved in cell wall biosynthesis